MVDYQYGMQSEAYSQTQKPLVRALILSITQRLRHLFTRETGVGGSRDYYIYHLHTRDFEDACDILWKLGASTAAFMHGDGPVGISFHDYKAKAQDLQKGFPPCFSLHPDEYLHQLALPPSCDATPSMDTIVEAYVCIATDYGKTCKNRLPIARNKPFSASHQQQNTLMEALVLNGYAIRTGTQYIWTDKIAPIMIKNWLWDDTVIDFSLVDEGKVSQETNKILNGLQAPSFEELTADLKQRPNTFRGLEIMNHWDGSKWSIDPLPTSYLSFDEAMSISRELEIKL